VLDSSARLERLDPSTMDPDTTQFADDLRVRS
jgi:hypothetical protein